MIRVVYLVGPYRAPSSWEVECNIRHAEVMAVEVARLGAMPLAPHPLTRFIDSAAPDEFWLAGTLELMRRCDAVLAIPGWAVSAGSRGEIAEATARKLPVFYSVSELRDALLCEANEELRQRLRSAP